MVNAVRSRGASGNRITGSIDPIAIGAPAINFKNQFSLRFDSPTSESVLGPVMNALGTTITNKFSVAIWHKWTGAGPLQFQGICNATTQWFSLGDGWSLYWADASTIHFYVNNFSNNFARASVPSAANWNFFVGVYDGTLGSNNIKVYSNGIVGNVTDNLTANLTGQSNSVEVGKTANLMNSGGVDDFTVGNCDEFAIWDSALNANEITALYNSGTAGFKYNQNSGLYVSANNLRLWWRLGDAGDTDGTDGIQDRSANGNHGTLVDITSVNFVEDTPIGGM